MKWLEQIYFVVNFLLKMSLFTITPYLLPQFTISASAYLSLVSLLHNESTIKCFRSLFKWENYSQLSDLYWIRSSLFSELDVDNQANKHLCAHQAME